MTTLLVLFVQSATLLLLGFAALFVTRRRGPAVQTLVGRATLSGVALLLLLLFSSANIVEEVSPWPGDTRKLVHFYGRYNVHPTDLKYIFTRVWVEGKPMSTIAPEKHLVDYALSADGQTITLKDKPVVVYRRSHTYTTHRPQRFLWI